MKNKKLNSSMLSMALAISLPMTAQAATVFLDDFDYANGTNLDGQSPDVGGTWSVTVGAPLEINGGILNTSGAGREAYASFSALGAGEVLTLTYTTSEPGGGNFFSDGYAGVSLYTGGTEQLFTGDGGGQNSWTVDGGAAGGSQQSGDTTVATTATFTYEYDTGAWTLTTTSGTDLSGSGTSNLSLDRLRVANGSGGDIAVDDLQVDISPIPEPGSAALIGLAGLGFMLRRRR